MKTSRTERARWTQWTQRSRVPILTIIAVLAIVGLDGCANSEKGDSQLKPDFIEGAKILHEWNKVYSVEARGAERVRTHVGFVDHRFSEEDPEGKSFVLDRTHQARGFLLAGGKAFVYDLGPGGVLGAVRDLGNTGLENGIKKILDTPGGIEVEAVKENAPATLTAPAANGAAKSDEPKAAEPNAGAPKV